MHTHSTEIGKTGQTDGMTIRVYPGTEGWKVAESEFSKLLAEFKAKEDALGYAMSLAETKRRTVVEVYGKGGILEVRSAYHAAKEAFG